MSTIAIDNKTNSPVYTAVFCIADTQNVQEPTFDSLKENQIIYTTAGFSNDLPIICETGDKQFYLLAFWNLAASGEAKPTDWILFSNQANIIQTKGNNYKLTVSKKQDDLLVEVEPQPAGSGILGGMLIFFIILLIIFGVSIGIYFLLRKRTTK